MKTVALTSSTIEKGYKLYSRYVQYVLKGAAYHGIPVLPVFLPFTDDPDVIRGYAHAFDGYLFTGGDDVSPARYGEERHPLCGEEEPERDAFEFALLRELMAADRPVFRPLGGMDKEEIIEVAREIGTFDTSILPYDDCCSVFTPRHPRTQPELNKVLREAARIDEEALIEEAWGTRHCVVIRQED